MNTKKAWARKDKLDEDYNGLQLWVLKKKIYIV